MFPAVGIEVGTKFMKVAGFMSESSNIDRWENAEGIYDIAVYYNTQSKAVGRLAKETKPYEQRSNIVYGISHFIGASDEDFMIQNLINLGAFNFNVEYSRRKQCYEINGIRANEIALNIYKMINEITYTKTKQKIPKSLVIAVPTHFTKNQRSEILNVFSKMGISKPAVFSDSTALIFNYINHMGFGDGVFAHVNIGVTLELTVLRVEGAKRFTVLKNCVYPFFISELLDNSLIELVVNRFCSQNHIKRSEFKVTDNKMAELISKIKDTKYYLASSSGFTNIQIPNFYQSKNLSVRIHYNDYAEKIDYIVTMVSELADIILDEYEDILNVFITGSSSKLGCLRDAIESAFPSGTVINKDADYSIALGAAQLSTCPSNYIEVNDIEPEVLTDHNDEVAEMIAGFRRQFGHFVTI